MGFSGAPDQIIIQVLVRESCKDNNRDITHNSDNPAKTNSLSAEEHIHKSELWHDD